MDDAREKWNRRYRERDASAEPAAPSEWLTENQAELKRHTGGRALDLACGTGRNALHLAQLGFTVDALDVSDVAIAQLSASAAQQRAAVHAREADLEHESLPEQEYDVVALLNYLQRDLFGSIGESLRPGGIVLAETVTRAHIEQLEHPFDPAFALQPGELATAFTGLRVLHYHEGVVQRSGRPRAVASVVAQRR
ncbi:MAG: class I SAM-dependent methyltransferase [Solirubrobacteraceae bacterium]